MNGGKAESSAVGVSAILHLTGALTLTSVCKAVDANRQEQHVRGGRKWGGRKEVYVDEHRPPAVFCKAMLESTALPRMLRATGL